MADGRDGRSRWLVGILVLGAFSTALTYPSGSGPDALATGDFNRDAHLDLAVTDFDGSVVRVRLQRCP